MIEMNYKMSGDTLIPDLTILETRPLGKYGRMRREYLRVYRPVIWNALLTAGKLDSHLAEIDETASSQVERVTSELAKRSGVNEEMKKRDQMGWVQSMNSLKAQAEEAVLTELVYS